MANFNFADNRYEYHIVRYNDEEFGIRESFYRNRRANNNNTPGLLPPTAPIAETPPTFRYLCEYTGERGTHWGTGGDSGASRVTYPNVEIITTFINSQFPPVVSRILPPDNAEVGGRVDEWDIPLPTFDND